jgi:hypothetical protein
LLKKLIWKLLFYNNKCKYISLSCFSELSHAIKIDDTFVWIRLIHFCFLFLHFSFGITTWNHRKVVFIVLCWRHYSQKLKTSTKQIKNLKCAKLVCNHWLYPWLYLFNVSLNCIYVTEYFIILYYQISLDNPKQMNRETIIFYHNVSYL